LAPFLAIYYSTGSNPNQFEGLVVISAGTIRAMRAKKLAEGRIRWIFRVMMKNKI
jgi:hypothetical protein